jgi:hypothetical protein
MHTYTHINRHSHKLILRHRQWNQTWAKGTPSGATCPDEISARIDSNVTRRNQVKAHWYACFCMHVWQWHMVSWDENCQDRIETWSPQTEAWSPQTEAWSPQTEAWSPQTEAWSSLHFGEKLISCYFVSVRMCERLQWPCLTMCVQGRTWHAKALALKMQWIEADDTHLYVAKTVKRCLVSQRGWQARLGALRTTFVNRSVSS